MGNQQSEGIPESELKEYDIEEVKTHNTADSLWIVVAGNVIDFTKFHKEHPGGPAVLLAYGGKDGTSKFTAVKHPDWAKDELKKLRIGKLKTAPVTATAAAQ